MCHVESFISLLCIIVLGCLFFPDSLLFYSVVVKSSKNQLEPEPSYQIAENVHGHIMYSNRPYPYRLKVWTYPHVGKVGTRKGR
jgi:hypothetical protein